METWPDIAGMLSVLNGWSFGLTSRGQRQHLTALSSAGPAPAVDSAELRNASNASIPATCGCPVDCRPVDHIRNAQVVLLL